MDFSTGKRNHTVPPDPPLLEPCGSNGSTAVEPVSTTGRTDFGVANFATQKSIVFAAFSKRNFFWRDHIVKYVLEHGRVPVSAFVMFGYFLADTLSRDLLIDANNDLVRRCDELWIFGEISNGVKAEIDLARSLVKPVKFFSINPNIREIKEVQESEAAYEKV